MASAVRVEHLLARVEDLHRPARLHRQLRHAELERERIALAAERAAEQRLDHAHLALRQPEHARQLAVHVMRDLRRAPDREVAVRVDARDRAVRLDGHVRGPRVPVRLAHDGRGPGHRLVDLAELQMDVLGDVPDLRPLVDLDLRMLERVLGREHRRQHFVVHLHQPQRLVRRPLVDGGDAGHGIADVAHFLHRERRLVLRPGDDAVLERQLGADQRRHHAGQRLGGARIDAADPRVRVRGPEDLRVQHPRQRDVVGVEPGTVGLRPAVRFGKAGADAHGTISLTVCAFESLGAARSDCTGARWAGARRPAATCTAS